MLSAFSLKSLGKDARAAKEGKSSKAEQMSKKLAREEQMFKRKLSLSKVKVSSSPTTSTPSSSPSSTHVITSSDVNLTNSQGQIFPEEKVVPIIPSRSRPPAHFSPSLASTSSSPLAAFSSSSAHVPLARRNSRIQITPINSLNINNSPRIKAISSPLSRARRSSLAPPTSPFLHPGRTQAKFSIRFLRMHNERKQRKAEEQTRKLAKVEAQRAIVGNINVLEQRLVEVRKLKESAGQSKCSEEDRIQTANKILHQLEQEVQVPEVTPTTKSKNNRMEEEEARRQKKKIAVLLIQQEKEVNPAASSIQDQDYLRQLEHQEKTIEKELTKLRSQCVESTSRDAIMHQEKRRREDRLALRALERRNSSSCSPRLRFNNKPLPPIRNGLFVKAAEAAKIAAQQDQGPQVLTRESRMQTERARRAKSSGLGDQRIPL